MKYSLLFCLFLVLSSTTLWSQSLLDNLILEDAQKAYAADNFLLCLEKIEELEKRGNKGLIILHLKIMSTSKINPNVFTFEDIVQFKEDVAYYLNNYDNEDFLQQYRDVYEVSKTLSDQKYDEGFFCKKKGDYYYFTKKDYEKAVEWYLRASALGNTDKNLQYTLGYCYANGQGTPVNYEEAAKWYIKAAQQDNPKAQNNLAVLYFYGQGLEKDVNKAIEWYEKSANLGNEIAQNNLGNLYYKGDNVPKDFTKAIFWFEKAARQNNSSAKLSLTHCYLHSGNAAKTMAWFINVEEDASIDDAAKNSLKASLAYALQNGQNGFAKNINQAIELYKELAESGREVYLPLAACYLENEMYEKAFESVLKVSTPIPDVGFYHYDGLGTPQSYTKAAAYWESVAERVPLSNLFLAVCYFSGNGVVKNRDKAVELINKVESSYPNMRKGYLQNFDYLHNRYPGYAKDEMEFFKYLRDKHDIHFE